ncbi:protein IWS1 homolog [Lingula anatina]|uniref:Protein IWS1 homolog n=1 Tax=Lingula anatina TaxID=7574 RepID=A0A1S3H961_LINAN|nr:protein IWS1 homolog [Lingula anatina]|eukprot:XP_013381664.1 protein IWS1 homolog [Lingula anatina]
MLLKCAVVAMLLGVMAAAPTLPEKRSDETIAFGNQQNKERVKKSDPGIESKSQEAGSTASHEKEDSLVDAKSESEVESKPVEFIDTQMDRVLSDKIPKLVNPGTAAEESEQVPSADAGDNSNEPPADSVIEPFNQDSTPDQNTDSETEDMLDEQDEDSHSDSTEPDISESKDEESDEVDKLVDTQPVAPPQLPPDADITDEEKALASLGAEEKTPEELAEDGSDDEEREEEYDYDDLKKYYDQMIYDRDHFVDPYVYRYYYPYLSPYDYRRKRSASLPARLEKRDAPAEEKELRRNKRSRRDVNGYNDVRFSEDELRDLWQLMRAAYNSRTEDEEDGYEDDQSYSPYDVPRYVPQEYWTREFLPSDNYDIYRYVPQNIPTKRNRIGFGYGIFDQRRAFSPNFRVEEDDEPRGYWREEPEAEYQTYEIPIRPYPSVPKRQYLSMVPGNKRAPFYPYEAEPQYGRWGAFIRKAQAEEKREKAAEEYMQLYNLARALGKHEEIEGAEEK